MQRDVATPAEYLALVPTTQLPLLHHLRSLILKAAPEVREEIRYGMLFYDNDGGLFGLAAQKNYVGLYIMATDAMREMADELKGLDHGKGCIRFKRLDAVPTPVIAKLLKRAAKSRGRACRD